MEGSEGLLNKLLSASEEEGGEEKARLLQLLIALSRSPVQRGILSACKAVPFLLPLVFPHAPSLLPLLKLLRNLCAGELSNQQSFLQSDGAHVISLVIDKALEGDLGEEVLVLQVSLQLLGNACGGGEAQKEAVWNTFFPERFKALARRKGQDRILEPLCMLFYTCSHGATHRLEQLCCGDGACLLSCCLQAAASQGILSGGASDWIYLLLADLCLRKPFLPQLFASLRDAAAYSTISDQLASQSYFSVEQSTLLCCLLGILADKVQAHGSILQREEAGSLPMPSLSIEFLAQTLQAASCFFKETILDVANTQLVGTPPYVTLPCAIPVINVLGYALGIFQLLSAWEQDKNSGGCRQARMLIVGQLLSYGVIKLCVELLESLGPPELIHQAMQRSKADGSTSEGSQTMGEEVSGVDQVERCSPQVRMCLPYHGYRRDLVAIIGNASYQNRAVQEEVRLLGGVSLVLQQCVVDDMNPFLREWGFWAVRNLLENNLENCKEVAELQLRGTSTPAELAQMGYKVEMDPLKGRPKLVNTSAVAEKMNNGSMSEKVVNHSG